LYAVVSHGIWHSGGSLVSLGMQDFAGSTVVHYQGALAALAGAILLGPRIGKFGHDGRANPIPGHNMPYAVLGTLILWFGWFGFNPGSTLAVVTGHRVGYFAYVALTTNLAAAAGARVEPRHRDRRARLHGIVPSARRAGARALRGRRVHLQRLVRLPVDDEARVGNPRRGARRDGRPGRVGARHVGLSGVLHPGPG